MFFLLLLSAWIPSLPNSAIVRDVLANAADYGIQLLQDVELEGMFSVRKYSNWGLLRIANKMPTITSTNYIYPTDAGKDVYIYIIDLYVPHDQSLRSEGKFVRFVDYTKKGFDKTNYRAAEIASIISHPVHGVASHSNVILNKVGYAGISNSEFATHLKKALADIIGNVTERQQRAVINMGLNCNALSQFDRIKVELLVQKAISNGIVVVKSAGNTNSDACDVSISNITEVITVGAIDSQNYLLHINETVGSNYGRCIDLNGPGSQLRHNKKELGVGTAYAAAHITGIVAIYLSFGVHFNDIKSTIIESGTHGIIRVTDKAEATPNIVAYNMPISHQLWDRIDPHFQAFLKFVG